MSIVTRAHLSTKSVIALAVGAALLASSLVLTVHAVSENNDAVDDSTNTLKVSPVRSDIKINPGQKKTVETIVTNLTDKEILIKAVTNDFIAGDERGTPALILDENEFAPTHSLKRFLGPIGNVKIPAGEAKSINVDITVPKDAQAGGYFGAVRFAPSAPDDGGQVNLSSSVASLILLRVPGDVVEKLDLTDFEVQQGGAVKAFFSSSNDLQASFRFQNSGNVQLGPFGKISVTNDLKDDELVYDTDFNTEDQRDVVLPDSARRWDVPLKEIGSFGKYTVSATFTYGEKNQTVEAKQSFWVIPWAVIISVIVAVLILIAIIVGIALFLKGYKKRILRGRGRF